MNTGDRDADLRRRAEARLTPPEGPLPDDPADLIRLVHELQVHQIELDIQNEELIRANETAELANRRLADLYDFAPVGYLTLTGEGVISGSNHTAARLLETPRAELSGRRLDAFVTVATRARLQGVLERTGNDGGRQSCEVELQSRPQGRDPWFVQVEAVMSADRSEYRLALLDITERRKAELVRMELLDALQDAMAKVKVLSGMLPVCSWCKRIRDDQGYWAQVEDYLSTHTEAIFTHAICPDCANRNFPDEGPSLRIEPRNDDPEDPRP